MPGSKLDAPTSTDTVRVRLIDTTTIMVLHSHIFIKPVIPGHETMNGPDVAFLIENDRLGKKALFDLGTRKDYWNLPPAILDRFDKLATGMAVPKDVKDVLLEKNIPLQSIDDIIWSHSHWDHIGDTTLFPQTTSLVYGPEVSTLRPGYPANPKSPLLESLFENRKNIEISFAPDGLTIGGFPAHDFYGDDSLYLLSTPGHAKGHLCALARTTPDTFILMGGDVCHFPGDLRPNPAYPMPDPIPEGVLYNNAAFPTPCPASLFLDNHPQLHDSASELAKSRIKTTTSADDNPNTTITPKELKHQLQTQHANHQTALTTTPFYALSTIKGTAYDTPSPAVAQSTINTLTTNFDSLPNVFVMLAHDPALLPYLPTLNANPDADLNDWFAQGWKDKCHWGWLNEVARPAGTNGKERIVDGWYRDGRRFDSAKDMLEAFERGDGEGGAGMDKSRGEGGRRISHSEGKL